MAANDYSGTQTWNFADLTVEIIMNIYRYGSESVPEYFGDHIRINKPIFTVEINTADYMVNGGGRYVTPANFSITQKFFGGEIIAPLIETSPGIFKTEFTVAELMVVNPGLTLSELRVSLKQGEIDSGSADYAERAFIYNTQTFVMSEDTIFKFQVIDVLGVPTLVPDSVKQTEIGIDGQFDDFDFTAGGLGQLANIVLLEPAFDPDGLGETINFIYSDGGQMVSDFDMIAFDAAVSSFPSNFLVDAIGPLLNLIQEQKAAHNIILDQNGLALLYGTNGDDFLDAIDIIAPGQDAHIVGGAGEDTIKGDLNNDLLEGNSDNDTLKGRGGDDILVGGEGEDTLKGGTGNDILYGHEAPNTPGAPADDNANDILKGNAGIDVLFGQGGDDKLRGGVGNDSLSGGAGADMLFGGADDDNLFGHGDTQIADDDSIDILKGNGGNDQLFGEGGDDDLNGGKDDDKLFGGDGDDVLYGGQGRGVDELRGEAGNDTLRSSKGGDIMDGGEGFDTADYSGSNGAITVTQGTTGELQVTGGHATGDTLTSIEFLTLSEKNDSIENIIAPAGPGTSLVFDGRGGNDEISVSSGSVAFSGGAGVDTVNLLTGNIENAPDVVFAVDGEDHSNDRIEVDGSHFTYTLNAGDYDTLGQEERIQSYNDGTQWGVKIWTDISRTEVLFEAQFVSFQGPPGFPTVTQLILKIGGDQIGGQVSGGVTIRINDWQQGDMGLNFALPPEDGQSQQRVASVDTFGLDDPVQTKQFVDDGFGPIDSETDPYMTEFAGLWDFLWGVSDNEDAFAFIEVEPVIDVTNGIEFAANWDINFDGGFVSEFDDADIRELLEGYSQQAETSLVDDAIIFTDTRQVPTWDTGDENILLGVSDYKVASGPTKPIIFEDVRPLIDVVADDFSIDAEPGISFENGLAVLHNEPDWAL